MEKERYYICMNCGAILDKPQHYSENIGEFWGAPAYDEFDVCPNCGEGSVRELSEDDQELYQMAFDTGLKSGKSVVDTRLKLLDEYIDCSKLTGEQVKMIYKEILHGKVITELVRQYHNK